MKYKIIIFIFILSFSVVAPQLVHAVPAAPSPTCEITANVLSVEKARTDSNGIGNSPSEDFDYYKINLDILEISTYNADGSGSCDDSYIKSVEQTNQILSVSGYNETPISKGLKIGAKIHFSGDERFGGFFLSDVQILEGTFSEEGITVNTTKSILDYWYFIIPVVIVLFIVILFIILRKRK